MLQNQAWGYDEKRDLPNIEATWTKLNAMGLGFYDSAEVYGSGLSEKIIGQQMARTSEEEKKSVIIATKWLPVPILPGRIFPPKGVVGCLKASLARMGLEQCDLYQVHGRVHFLTSIETVAKGLAECVKLGLTKTVGVSNYSEEHMVRMYEALKKEGIPLASNQFEFSLLRRLPENNGLLKACHDRGIVPLAYSPIGQGRLSGKYSVENPPPKGRSFGNFPMETLAPLLDVMRGIAEKRNVPMTAVALNWIMCKGAIPLPGARNAQQAEQNAQCLGWRLTNEEIAALEEKSQVGGNNFWQQASHHCAPEGDALEIAC
ncbi:hypothetical protein EMMF5_004546 [Cystobasidiomycetes sp. EMM_F5]